MAVCFSSAYSLSYVRTYLPPFRGIVGEMYCKPIAEVLVGITGGGSGVGNWSLLDGILGA